MTKKQLEENNEVLRQSQRDLSAIIFNSTKKWERYCLFMAEYIVTLEDKLRSIEENNNRLQEYHKQEMMIAR